MLLRVLLNREVHKDLYLFLRKIELNLESLEGRSHKRAAMKSGDRMMPWCKIKVEISPENLRHCNFQLDLLADKCQSKLADSPSVKMKAVSRIQGNQRHPREEQSHKDVGDC